MSEHFLTLESGPGSYDIQDSLGYLSQKHYNPPRAVISKAEKTNKLFLSVELSKQFSGADSPGVNTYDPNRDLLLSKSPSALFGKEERTMSHIRPLLNRSPGPVYDQISLKSKLGISFSKARRNSVAESLISPAPWDYSPKLTSKVPSFIFRSAYERTFDKFLTPGPGSYNIPDRSPQRAYVSKVGRNIIGYRDISPGPGAYESNTNKHISQLRFGSSKRNTDPRLCNNYTDANPHDFYR